MQLVPYEELDVGRAGLVGKLHGRKNAPLSDLLTLGLVCNELP